MKDLLRAECLKIITVPSTIYLLVFSLLSIVLFAGYAQGYQANYFELINPNLLNSQINQASIFLSNFAFLIVFFLVSHEYRYNTQPYSLLAANKRTKVFLTKIISIVIFIFIFTLIISIVSPCVNFLGINLHNLKLVHQTFSFFSYFGQALVYNLAFVLFGVILVMIIRKQVTSLILVFVASFINSIAALQLHANQKYLPLTALNNIISVKPSALLGSSSLYIVLGYLLIGLLISWILFVKRDLPT